MKKIDFYFDIISPYVWLASSQMPEFEQRFSIRFLWRPVLFAGLLNAHGNLGPAEIPAKREYTLKDVLRWAQHYGLSYQGPPEHPFNPLKALRILTAVEEDSTRAQLGTVFLQGVWERGLDITKDNVLLELIKSVLKKKNISAEALLEKSSTISIKNKLAVNTKEAVSRGAFGVPTFILEKELFWGHDRLELLADDLSGRMKIDLKRFQDLLKRPRGADRSLMKLKTSG